MLRVSKLRPAMVLEPQKFAPGPFGMEWPFRIRIFACGSLDLLSEAQECFVAFTIKQRHIDIK